MDKIEENQSVDAERNSMMPVNHYNESSCLSPALSSISFLSSTRSLDLFNGAFL